MYPDLNISLQTIQKEIEKRQQQLKNIQDLGDSLKAVIGEHGNLVDDKLSLLNSNWLAVTSRAEEWFCLLLVSTTLLLYYNKQIIVVHIKVNISSIYSYSYRYIVNIIT